MALSQSFYGGSHAFEYKCMCVQKHVCVIFRVLATPSRDIRKGIPLRLRSVCVCIAGAILKPQANVLYYEFIWKDLLSVLNIKDGLTLSLYVQVFASSLAAQEHKVG